MRPGCLLLTRSSCKVFGRIGTDLKTDCVLAHVPVFGMHLALYCSPPFRLHLRPRLLGDSLRPLRLFVRCDTPLHSTLNLPAVLGLRRRTRRNLSRDRARLQSGGVSLVQGVAHFVRLDSSERREGDFARPLCGTRRLEAMACSDGFELLPIGGL